MNGYLLDSDILIWYLRGGPEIVKKVKLLGSKDYLGCSVISILEVEAGMKPGEEEKTIAFLEGLRSYPIDKSVARKAAAYIRQFKPKGISLDFADTLIAATASLNNLTLVTINVVHYPMEDIKLYEWATGD
jgi:predicted nucleic acid-binding protein